MSGRDALDWQLTDENLPDLFDLAAGSEDAPEESEDIPVELELELELELDHDDPLDFSHSLAADIANTLTGEFPAIDRPSTQAPVPKPTVRPRGLRKIERRRIPARQNPPSVSGKQEAAKASSPPSRSRATRLGRIAIGRPTPSAPAPKSSTDEQGESMDDFRIEQQEEDMFALEQDEPEKTVTIDTSTLLGEDGD